MGARLPSLCQPNKCLPQPSRALGSSHVTEWPQELTEDPATSCVIQEHSQTITIKKLILFFVMFVSICV